jgi:hypothetical protein
MPANDASGCAAAACRVLYHEEVEEAKLFGIIIYRKSAWF